MLTWLTAKTDVASSVASINPFGMTGKQWEVAKAQYLSGKGWKTISDDLNVPVDTLRSRACREGVTKLKAQMQTVCVEKKTQTIEDLSKLVRSKLAQDAVSTLERVDKYDINDIREENTREQVLASISKRSALVFGWSDQSENATVSINLLGALPDKTLNITPSNEIE